MNSSQLQSIAKVALTFIGGIMASFGWISSDDMSKVTADVLAVIGPATALVTLVWGIYQHSTANKIASTAALPEVKTVVTTPALANAIPASNVVSDRPGSAPSVSL